MLMTADIFDSMIECRSHFFIIFYHTDTESSSGKLCSAFIAEIGMPEQFIFVDESAKDERTPSRRYGYSYVNARARLRVEFVRGKRYSILPTLRLDGMVMLVSSSG